MDDVQNTSTDDSFPNLAKDLQKYLKSAFDSVFGTRKRVNDNEATLLIHSDKLNKEVNEIREEFSIPDLDSSKDILEDFVIDGERGFEAHIVESRWLESQGALQKSKFKEKINFLIKENNLPQYFDEWVEGYVLYNKTPSYMPLYNLDFLLGLLLVDPQKPVNLGEYGLTTKEKKFLLRYLRLGMGEKVVGRVSDKNQALYDGIKKKLEVSKSSRRGYRTMETALKTLDIGKKKLRYEPTENKDVLEKTSYNSVVASIYDDDVDNGLKKQRIRKVKERLYKRKERKLEN